MSAENLIGDKNLKFLFVGGKGGVGKTTTSAAIAMQLSYDRKVLLLSTDPAHSLSDAFRETFTDVPKKVDGVPNLEVLEVNPDKILKAEVDRWVSEAEKGGYDDILANVKEFQQWLISVPGIDEAMALTNVINYIEDGSYDIIVFDTAPTGHTLKLLGMPKALQVGLDKLESVQAKLWGYWSTMKSFSSGKNNIQNIQKNVKARLNEYKTAIEKIGIMLKDKERTNFAVVCIAEHLSINESLRLLTELERHEISVSHVFVNQLVKDSLETEEMKALEDILKRVTPPPTENEPNLLARMKNSVQLCHSRRSIQQKYLASLNNSKEVNSKGITVVEIPLLPSEVTGSQALLQFSQLFMPEGYRKDGPEELKEWKPSPFIVNVPQKEVEKQEKNKDEEKPPPTVEVPKDDDVPTEQEVQFKVGDTVRTKGLKAAKYNDLEGKVFSLNNKDGRLGIEITFQNAPKKLLLKKVNLTKVEDPKPKRQKGGATEEPKIEDPMAGMKNKLLADPEVQEKLKDPKFKAAWDSCQENPMNALQYMSDPDIGPFMMKMMSNFGMGGMGNM